MNDHLALGTNRPAGKLSEYDGTHPVDRERLDERISAIDQRLDYLSTEIAALRGEMRAGFAALQSQVAELRAEIAVWHRQLNRIFGGFAIAAVGLLAASHF